MKFASACEFERKNRAPDRGALFRYRMVESYQASRRKEVPRMNEMQAHGLLIPVGSKPFEVWIDKNNSLAELQDLVNGNVEVLRVLGNGVALWVNDEGLFNISFRMSTPPATSMRNLRCPSPRPLQKPGRIRWRSTIARATTTTAVAISSIRVQSTTSIQSVTNQNCMNRFKEIRR